MSEEPEDNRVTKSCLVLLEKAQICWGYTCSQILQNGLHLGQDFIPYVQTAGAIEGSSKNFDLNDLNLIQVSHRRATHGVIDNLAKVSEVNRHSIGVLEMLDWLSVKKLAIEGIILIKFIWISRLKQFLNHHFLSCSPHSSPKMVLEGFETQQARIFDCFSPVLTQYLQHRFHTLPVSSLKSHDTSLQSL